MKGGRRRVRASSLLSPAFYDCFVKGTRLGREAGKQVKAITIEEGSEVKGKLVYLYAWWGYELRIIIIIRITFLDY